MQEIILKDYWGNKKSLAQVCMKKDLMETEFDNLFSHVNENNIRSQEALDRLKWLDDRIRRLYVLTCNRVGAN